MNRTTLNLWLTAGALAMSVLAAVVYHHYRDSVPLPVVRAPLDASCTIQKGPCTLRMPGSGTARFAVTPRPIHPLHKLHLEVQLEGLKADRVEVDFAGVDMNMGPNRVLLLPDRPGHYTGTAMLTVCVRNRMYWEAQVLVYTGDKVLSFPYRFDTVRG